MRFRFIEPLESRQLLSTLPANFTETTVAHLTTNTAPAMAFTPDGRLFVNDTSNMQVRVIKNGALLATPAINLSVDKVSERGINGIVFDPNFASAPAGQKYVYIYYTTATNIHNRLSRFAMSTTNPDVIDPGTEKFLIDDIAATNGNHNGGSLHFGADGKLYLGVGEAGVSSNAQTLSNLNGKILRINSDGTIPSDNPFVNTAGARPEIWAWGFRNPFTSAFKPGTNTLYVNDVGQATWEEIDDVQKGQNYGWPTVEGIANNPSFADPIYQYAHNGKAVAITGAVFYNGSQFPSSYSGKYFFGDYILKTISYLDPATKKVTAFATGTKPVVDFDVNPIDGSLWYLSVDGNVQKIAYKTPTQTTTTLRAGADAYGRDGSFATQSFGSSTQLQVKKSTTGFTRNAFLRFDLSTVSTIGSAKLRVWGSLDNPTSKSVSIEIDAVDSTTWGESTLTWNNKPAVGAKQATFTVLDTTARWYEIDLTSFLKAQKTAGKKLVSIALRAVASVVGDAVFNSDEASTNKPQLVITAAANSATASVARPQSAIAAAADSGGAWQRLEADNDAG